MIQGTSSDVGKSVLVAALCRIFTRRGVRTAPFKAQNMALNSFVTPDGLELGRSQAVQAQAAGVDPDVNMNPILLKPEADSRSQVVLLGKPWKTLAAGSYYQHKQELWRHVTESLETLMAKFELVIIEGAGSPAEINLKAHEIVNMRVARHISAPVVLAADIDRGGVFAFLYGTLMLLEPEERELIRGFIINKFRGDPQLLEPGLAMLSDLTDGRPTVGVIPFLRNLGVAQEDSVFLDSHSTIEKAKGSAHQVDIAVIHFPHISNYDDFDAFGLEDDVRVRFVQSAPELGVPDAVVLPGTKTTAGDLAWLHSTGLAKLIVALSVLGKPIAGICGGYQMLGTVIRDKLGVEDSGQGRSLPGLNLLPLDTDFEPHKKTNLATARVLEGPGFLKFLEERRVDGYEIHMGRTERREGALPLLQIDRERDDGTISSDGKIWGTYLHGIFDTPSFRRAWLRSIGWHATGFAKSLAEHREEQFVRLADHVETHLDMKLLNQLIGL